MSETQLSILLQLLGISYIVSLYFVSLKSPPKWVSELQTKWKTIAFASLAGGVIGFIGVSIIYNTLDPLPLLATSLAMGILSFCLVQSIFTDFQLHLVDRRILYLGMIPTGLVNIITAINLEQNGTLFDIWAITVLAGIALIFLPFIMGPSDGRAILLTAIAVFPVIGEVTYFFGLMMFVLIAFFSIIVKAAIKGVRAKSVRNFIKNLTSREHHPIVPFILLPFVIIIPLANLF